MAMSLSPTYGRVSPAAMVETMSLGTPTGRACMAAAASDAPPLPPIARVPSRRAPRRPPPGPAAAPAAPPPPPRRLVHHARVDDEHVRAELLEPSADEI